MARFDKYSGVTGGFRAPLFGAIIPPMLGGVFAVGLDANGLVVLDPGQTNFIGIIVPDRAMNAGDTIDVMTHGEIVEFDSGAGGLPFVDAVAGTVYYAAGPGGIPSATPPSAGSGGVRLGHTVEATRLVVRVQAISIPAGTP